MEICLLPIGQKKGATLSDKSARKEFGLTQDQIIEAIKIGKLQFRQNHIHGNPYFRLLRNEVESLSKELFGNRFFENHKLKYKLSQINKEINSLKRKIKALEKEKAELLERNATLGLTATKRLN